MFQSCFSLCSVIARLFCIYSIYILLCQVCNISSLNISLFTLLFKEGCKYVTSKDVISEVFENCLIRRFDSFLMSSDHRMEFKKGISCSHAIYSFCKIVDHYTVNGSTFSVCTLDLSKAFDKVDHSAFSSALLVKLMNRNVPVNLLILLEYWFANS